MPTSTSNSPLKKSLDPLVLQNKLAVSLAQKRKLISSWLPPSTADELANGKSVEEIAAEDEEIWRSRPATLGVGHPIPSSGSSTDNYNREDDLLRRRLLGQNAIKDARQRHLERTQSTQQSRRLADSDSDSELSEDEHLSRGSAVTKASKRRRISSEDEDDTLVVGTGKGEGGSNHEEEGNVEIDSGGFVALQVKSTPKKGKKRKKKSNNVGSEANDVSSASVVHESEDGADDSGSDGGTDLTSPTQVPSSTGKKKKKKKKKEKGSKV
ncbi:hypothetical protein ABW19_dt0206246 [Dactylella cylindrospora]|nr:hypothetical protein ABW19_dt0206246 [Dactylella cylindrospora]